MTEFTQENLPAVAVESDLELAQLAQSSLPGRFESMDSKRPGNDDCASWANSRSLSTATAGKFSCVNSVIIFALLRN